jgi:AcrR family transcriptional regulator
MQRARQAHQKQQRREVILAMALETLRETPYRDITMTQVAARAGLVKGTLYLYFATKEELFLEVLRDQLHGWFWDLETGLETLPRRGRIEASARLIADTTAARPAFRVLLGVLHGVLEQNLPEHTALSFQREWLARTLSLGVLLERALPFLAEGQGLHLLLQLYALIIGVQCLAEPSARVHQLLERPELASFRLEFSRECLRGARALMVGLKAENDLAQGRQIANRH